MILISIFKIMSCVSEVMLSLKRSSTCLYFLHIVFLFPLYTAYRCLQCHRVQSGRVEAGRWLGDQHQHNAEYRTVSRHSSRAIFVWNVRSVPQLIYSHPGPHSPLWWVMNWDQCATWNMSRWGGGRRDAGRVNTTTLHQSDALDDERKYFSFH